MENHPAGNPLSTVIACPECGGDCGVLKVTSRNWTHPSRVIPSIAWLILVLALVVYWVSIGTWGSYTQGIDLRNRVGSEFRSQLVPWSPSSDRGYESSDDHEVIFLSSTDLEHAVDGDAEALEQVKDVLQYVVDYADAKVGVSGLLGVRYAFKEPDGYILETTEYGFGGNWLSSGWGDTTPDIRDATSIHPEDHNDWESVEWTLFPDLSYTKQSSNTTIGSSMVRSIHVHSIEILGVLSVCMLVAWCIRWAGTRSGVRIFEKRFAWSAMVAAFFGLCALGALLSPQTTRNRSTITSQMTAFSTMYPIEAMRASAMDQEKVIEWCRQVLALIPDPLPLEYEARNIDRDDLLLGQHWIFDQSAPQASHQMDFQLMHANIGDRFPLIHMGHADYPPEVAEEDLPKSARWEVLGTLREGGAIVRRWGSPRNLRYVFVYPAHIALLAMSFLWAWAIFHWVGRLALGRVQRRRVKRDQCTFCAYPLSEPALKARSGVKTP